MLPRARHHHTRRDGRHPNRVVLLRLERSRRKAHGKFIYMVGSRWSPMAIHFLRRNVYYFGTGDSYEKTVAGGRDVIYR